MDSKLSISLSAVFESQTYRRPEETVCGHLFFFWLSDYGILMNGLVHFFFFCPRATSASGLKKNRCLKFFKNLEMTLGEIDA